MLDKMPVKTRRFNLTADYDGWWCDVRVNTPLGIFLDKLEILQKVDTSDPIKVAPALYDILKLVIIEWNFKDENGQALPCNSEGLKCVPSELLWLMVDAIKGETLTVPLAQGSS
jgi:hypothetical protein